ncbi:hypothetical protein SBI_08566 [Streptomyces bingchenggensis BCW-1]|uniref:Uncharacterized protein n=1 Tax=Streptomyces bingchenggensis (strain BCW-1) TaxID=749414 RepID=D7BUD5_STRBB|nr:MULTISPECIES: hypothetical protein [Streptomyces]ADI11684.1 hypothetical protein SBI_08566 [Streptomyces bingchenggensis BCW-1]
MYHRPAPRRPHTVASSPLEELEQSFLALARAEAPLTLPAHLVCDDPAEGAWPVDRIRTRLAHPSTRPELRSRTWCEVVRRAHTLGEPWSVVAVAMTIPVLRRMLARLPRPAHLERQEVEQEALAAVAVALTEVDAADPGLDRELFGAADRAVHRLVYAARRRSEREAGEPMAYLGRLHATTGMEGDAVTDEHQVLVRAVRARVVDLAEAQLIARTRLYGEPMQQLACERGVSMRQLYRHRNAAEQRLASHLRLHGLQ